MKPLAFLHSPEAVGALERAARCAATPLSLHYVERGEAGPEILRLGQCAACDYVAGLPGGKEACRVSRTEGALAAVRRSKPAAFVCYMGFGCVAVPALPEVDSGFVLTFCPYCPAEEPRALEADALRGLDTLSAPVGDAFPVSLADIRVVPASALPELAAWTVEVLAGLWLAAAGELSQPPVTESPAAEIADAGRHTPHSPMPDPYHAGSITAALVGGNQPQARALVRAALAESRSGQRVKIDVRRARVVAAVSGVLEAAERAQVDVAGSWDRFADFVTEVRRARTDEQLTTAAMRLVGSIKRRAKRSATHAHSFVALDQLIMARFPDKVLLQDVAKELGVHPTAVTHWLQRKFSMSFSEHVSRIRIDKAKELLRRTRLTVADIAQRVGIRDASNLGKLFRKFEGMSPLEYRRQFGRKR